MSRIILEGQWVEDIILLNSVAPGVASHSGFGNKVQSTAVRVWNRFWYQLVLFCTNLVLKPTQIK